MWEPHNNYPLKFIYFYTKWTKNLILMNYKLKKIKVKTNHIHLIKIIIQQRLPHILSY